ncbi:hypothetical protein QS306_15595 [Paraburkholderia bonniea]|uniref:hypothetical protein n=1 Tax=Paraburkholderia bonniea TaxID=2152891 RepID=UPI001291F961|nr:hypothetical protein [Paraburkholderia bonniea]WJF91512.1 hypothetical protein QS306_15595 [Paraburkholderia bonniea]WJF94831.1 hypothetical protein QS308_15600 [Paraburkholderia bonniea]
MSFTSSSSPSIVGVNRTSLDFNDISRSGSGINGEVQSTGEHPRHSKQNTSDLPHASTLSQRNMSVDLPENQVTHLPREHIPTSNELVACSRGDESAVSYAPIERMRNLDSGQFNALVKWLPALREQGFSDESSINMAACNAGARILETVVKVQPNLNLLGYDNAQIEAMAMQDDGVNVLSSVLRLHLDLMARGHTNQSIFLIAVGDNALQQLKHHCSKEAQARLVDGTSLESMMRPVMELQENDLSFIRHKGHRALAFILVRAYGYKLTQSPFNLDKVSILSMTSKHNSRAIFENLLKMGKCLIDAEYSANDLVSVVSGPDGINRFKYLVTFHAALKELNFSVGDILKMAKLANWKEKVVYILENRIAGDLSDAGSLVKSTEYLWRNKYDPMSPSNQSIKHVPVSAPRDFWGLPKQFSPENPTIQDPGTNPAESGNEVEFNSDSGSYSDNEPDSSNATTPSETPNSDGLPRPQRYNNLKRKRDEETHTNLNHGVVVPAIQSPQNPPLLSSDELDPKEISTQQRSRVKNEGGSELSDFWQSGYNSANFNIDDLDWPEQTVELNPVKRKQSNIVPESDYEILSTWERLFPNGITG